MAEGEQGFDPLLLDPAVTDEDPVAVDDLPVAGILPGGVGAAILQTYREGEGQFTRRVDGTEQYVGQRIAGLGARIPDLQYGGHAVDPRHRHGIARDDRHGQVGVGFGQSPDHGILSVRQPELQTVGAFGILMVALVQAADKHHGIHLAGCGDGIGEELSPGATFREILSGHNPVVVARHVADVTALVEHLGLVADGRTDALQGGTLVFHLERRGTAADGHHLHGVLAHDKQFLRFRKVDGKHPAVVLEQHHTLARDAACGGIMLRRAERPEGFAAVHRRAEDPA